MGSDRSTTGFGLDSWLWDLLPSFTFDLSCQKSSVSAFPGQGPCASLSLLHESSAADLMLAHLGCRQDSFGCFAGSFSSESHRAALFGSWALGDEWEGWGTLDSLPPFAWLRLISKLRGRDIKSADCSSEVPGIRVEGLAVFWTLACPEGHNIKTWSVLSLSCSI